MNFLVITSAPSLLINKSYHAYTPYVIEMDLWFSQVEEVVILSPTSYSKKLLTAPFTRKDIKVISVPNITFNIKSILKSVAFIPFIFSKMFSLMCAADHIHLRCPGNMGLLGCIVQIFFPNKNKSAKYAGNWDPKAKQPLSYKLQKWILNNEFLTRNMQVMVYGDWEGLSKNCVPFFTATYSENKKETPDKNFEAPYKMVFVGTLSKGKRPLYAVQLVNKLREKGIDIELDIYGEGECRNELEDYIIQNNLTGTITLQGNQTPETLEKAYKESYFLILPSKSEGWPKVVAEAMFWGLIPIATPISCVPEMLDNGNRGLLLTLDTEIDSKAFLSLLKDKAKLQKMSKKASQWSQQYTLEYFEKGIEKIIKAN